MQIRTAHLIEGVRLDGLLELEPFAVRPVPIERGFGGRDLREVFNAELAECGAVTEIGRAGWGAQFAPYRRFAFAMSSVMVVDDPPGALRANALAERLTVSLTLTFGGAPRVVATVIEMRDGPDAPWRTLAIMAGGGRETAPSLMQLSSDRQPIDPVRVDDVWDRATSDPRFGLWLSLYRDALADGRWDARVFRVCSLLEGIGAEVLPAGFVVLDDADGPLMLSPERPATTNELRGVLYELARRAMRAIEIAPEVLLTHPDRELWAEVRVWADLRNAVAHAGTWRDDDERRQRRLSEAFQIAGRGSEGEGRVRYAVRVCAAAEAVLRAVAAGAFDAP